MAPKTPGKLLPDDTASPSCVHLEWVRESRRSARHQLAARVEPWADSGHLPCLVLPQGLDGRWRYCPSGFVARQCETREELSGGAAYACCARRYTSRNGTRCSRAMRAQSSYSGEKTGGRPSSQPSLPCTGPQGVCTVHALR